MSFKNVVLHLRVYTHNIIYYLTNRAWCEDITFAEEIFFPTLARVSRDIFEKTGKVVQGKTLASTKGLSNIGMTFELKNITDLIKTRSAKHFYLKQS